MKERSTKTVSARLVKWVEKFRDVPILVVGDLMVDRSFRGPAERLSPEAPVPVIHVQEQSISPGGAGNVTCNLAALGAKPLLISVRGDDPEGEQIVRELEDRRINTSNIFIDPERPTISKTRLIAGHQQVARFDFEKRGHLSRELLQQILKRLAALIPNHRCVVISDYGKGVINSAVIKTALKEAHRHKISVIVDPKIEHFMQYKGVDCITPNTKEAVEGMRVLFPKTEGELVELGKKVLKKLRCRSLLITRGEKGMALFEGNGAVHLIPTLAQEVFDVTGAGDTVVAAFSLARAVGVPHGEAAQLANLAASVVVAKLGTAVVTKEELVQRLKKG